MLNAREAEVDKLLAAHKPTIPSTIGEDRGANPPFLRADVPEVAKALGLADSPAWKVFAEIRERKNSSGNGFRNGGRDIRRLMSARPRSEMRFRVYLVALFAIGGKGSRAS